jgi:hypothetical protein
MATGTEPQKNERIKLKGWQVKSDERPRSAAERIPSGTVPPLDDDWMMDDDFLQPDEPGSQKPDKPSGNPSNNSGNNKPGSTKPDVSTPEPSKPDTTRPDDRTGSQPDNSRPDSSTNPTADGVMHTVAKGDTLYNISKRYGTTVEAIQRLNGLTGTGISIGQILRVK